MKYLMITVVMTAIIQGILAQEIVWGEPTQKVGDGALNYLLQESDSVTTVLFYTKMNLRVVAFDANLKEIKSQSIPLRVTNHEARIRDLITTSGGHFLGRMAPGKGSKDTEIVVRKFNPRTHELEAEKTVGSFTKKKSPKIRIGEFPIDKIPNGDFEGFITSPNGELVVYLNPLFAREQLDQPESFEVHCFDSSFSLTSKETLVFDWTDIDMRMVSAFLDDSGELIFAFQRMDAHSATGSDHRVPGIRMCSVKDGQRKWSVDIDNHDVVMNTAFIQRAAGQNWSLIATAKEAAIEGDYGAYNMVLAALVSGEGNQIWSNVVDTPIPSAFGPDKNYKGTVTWTHSHRLRIAGIYQSIDRERALLVVAQRGQCNIKESIRSNDGSVRQFKKIERQSGDVVIFEFETTVNYDFDQYTLERSIRSQAPVDRSVITKFDPDTEELWLLFNNEFGREPKESGKEKLVGFDTQLVKLDDNKKSIDPIFLASSDGEKFDIEPSRCLSLFSGGLLLYRASAGKFQLGRITGTWKN